MVITQNGEAKAVVQDIHSYEETQESLAMLKILAMSGQTRSRACQADQTVRKKLFETETKCEALEEKSRIGGFAGIFRRNICIHSLCNL